jgi:glycerol-3-phosphate dehydrogenase
MKIAIIGAGKWGLTIMERFMSKAHKTTLTLGRLQQSAHATGCIKGAI